MKVIPAIAGKKKIPRQLRVANEVKRVLSEFLLQNEDVSSANWSIASMIVITDVEVSSDLQYAKVFLSTISPKISQKECLDFMEAYKYKLRAYIGALIRLKFTPDLHFFIDNSAEQAEKIENILKKVIQK